MKIKPCLVCGKPPIVEVADLHVMIKCVESGGDEPHFIHIGKKTEEEIIKLWNNLMTDQVVK